MENQQPSCSATLTSSLNQSGACVDATEGGSDISDFPVRSTGGGLSQGINRPTTIPSHTVSWGSQQWRLLRRALRDGVPIEVAAESNGMSLFEARALAKLDAEREPLPPEAFELLYDPAARAAQPKEPQMADNEEDDQTNTEVPQKDPALARRLYLNDFKPAQTQMQKHKQVMGEAVKSIRKDAKIQPKAAAIVHWANEAEENNVDDFWRSLELYANESAGRRILTYHGNDLVDRANELAADLEGASSIFEEASEEELAAQEGRSKPKSKQAASAEAAALH